MNSALEVLENISNSPALLEADLKYCYMNKDKVPYIGTLSKTRAKPNDINCFVSLDKMNFDYATEYAGLGISVQASKICGIDVDHCFSEPFNINSIDVRGEDIINRFKDFAYIEFSFSGTGLRVFFKANEIKDYKEKYYIKNSNTQCEYYYCQSESFRYLSITGKTIVEHKIELINDELLLNFLNTYMVRPKIVKKSVAITNKNETIHSFANDEQALKYYKLKNKRFQDVWFSTAPGSGADESERDFFLVKFIFENITINKDKIREIFEQSDFYKSKDYKHKKKWENPRYLDYIYGRLLNG